jgi:enoyl-[acyl-carrier protein] reductase/trans-2-enoyl-CoA reductase (NAD+)
VVNNDNLFQLTDYKGYKHEFLKLFGFERADVDYEADIATEVDFKVISTAEA